LGEMRLGEMGLGEMGGHPLNTDTLAWSFTAATTILRVNTKVIWELPEMKEEWDPESIELIR